MNIENRNVSEQISQLIKGIEVIGGNKYLRNKSSSNIMMDLLNQVFTSDKVVVVVNDKEYLVKEILKCKQGYEKDFLKGKLKAVNAIVYKIKKYDSSLDSLIRKYKKSKSLEEYNNITSLIYKTYRQDINSLVLLGIENHIIVNLTLDEQENFYGEYLCQKRKQIIDSIISKMGIV